MTAGGTTGLGYTYATGACKPLIEGELAAAIAGVSTLDTGGLAGALAVPGWQQLVQRGGELVKARQVRRG